MAKDFFNTIATNKTNKLLTRILSDFVHSLFEEKLYYYSNYSNYKLFYKNCLIIRILNTLNI